MFGLRGLGHGNVKQGPERPEVLPAFVSEDLHTNRQVVLCSWDKVRISHKSPASSFMRPRGTFNCMIRSEKLPAMVIIRKCSVLYRLCGLRPLRQATFHLPFVVCACMHVCIYIYIYTHSYLCIYLLYLFICYLFILMLLLWHSTPDTMLLF